VAILKSLASYVFDFDIESVVERHWLIWKVLLVYVSVSIKTEAV
jgi:hypothetical protein